MRVNAENTDSKLCHNSKQVSNNNTLYVDCMPWMMGHLVVVTLKEQEVELKVDTCLKFNSIKSSIP
jgi:hypothetical protein